MAYEDPTYRNPDDEFEDNADKVLTQLGIHPHHFGMGVALGGMSAPTMKDAYPQPSVPPPAAPDTPKESKPLVSMSPEPEEPKEDAVNTGIGSPLRPPSPTMQRTINETDTAQKEYDRLNQTGSGISQVKNPWLRGLARAGDIAGTAFFPGPMSLVPGTEMHHRALVDTQEDKIKQGLAQQKVEAETEKERLEGADKEQTPEQQAFNDLIKQVNPDTKKPYTPEEAFRKVMQDKAGMKPEKLTPAEAAFAEYIKRGDNPVDAFRKVQETLTEVKPDTSAQDDQRYETLMQKQYAGGKLTRDETAWVRAYERRKELGPIASGREAANRQGERDVQQATREARREILKAQNQYQNSKEAGEALDGFIRLAQSGNREAAATVPLEGTLRIVTAQGVKRINRTEVEGIQGAGSLFDMIQGKVQKLTEGQPIPPDLLRDFKQLNDMLIEGSYRNYEENWENTKNIFPEVDFSKFKKIERPGTAQQPKQERSVTKEQLTKIAHDHNMSYADAKKDAETHGIKVIE